MTGVRFPAGHLFSFSPLCPDRLWGSSNLFSMGSGDFSWQ